MINMFDTQDVILRKRVDKIEAQLGLPESQTINLI